MKETVATAVNVSRSGIIRQAGSRLTKALEHGGPMGPEFIACGAFPRTFARSYATAEESGCLDKDLAGWSLV